MTREEEIKLTADKYCRDEYTRLGFIAGAEWADAHPASYDGKAMLYVNNRSNENGYKEAVDKACEWMDCYVDNYLFVDMEDAPGIRWGDFLNDFRKAMKGE